MRDSRDDIIRYAQSIDSGQRRPEVPPPRSPFTSGFQGCLGVALAIVCVVIGIPLALAILGAIIGG